MKETIKINITDVTGSNICVSTEDGAAVNEKLNIAWDQDKRIELDFQGVDLLISAFLNSAIGRLVKEHSIEEIKSRICFRGLSKDDEQLIERVLVNAKAYYADPDKFKRALDEEESEEDEDENEK